ncbi:restriction endonuclease subunit S [Corynebacterium sp. HS2168-gen11]|uniref:restriction endonuclease subunit S n=1 Tax=Corynebacterium sp. HS2168-gen11 TaxID=2974027 RepID=UPI00216AC494|nr:restriction endonuclease subunit S [Corynebacterium sp. HS2168-gen11]MCS4536042.1 restriction endonuclease subunit S [Corynebacterium sp. HS2168-gen11]
METYEQYKSSGVPWVGNVPSNWTVASLARFTNIATGNMDTVDAVPNGKYPLYVRSPIIRRSDCYTFNTHAVLMSGDGAGAGRIFHRVDGKFGCHQRVYCIEFHDGIDRDFGYYYLSSFFPTQVDAGSAKSTVDSIRLPMLKGFRLTFPDIVTQRIIASFLDSKTSEIDDAIKGLVRQRELLERYRRELIAHTVTKGLNPDAPMKDSGEDWIGLVPENWRVAPAKALFSKRSESEQPDDVHLTPSQKFGVIPQEQYIEISGSKPMLKLSSAGSMRHVEPGDFIIHLRSFQGGLELSSFVGKVSAAYTVITPRDSETQRYFRWLLKSAPYISKLSSLTNQLRDGQNITYGTFTLMRLPSPPIAIQTEVADFLDSKTAEIDGLMADIDRQVELLRRYRKQIINDVVTGKVRVSKES